MKEYKALNGSVATIAGDTLTCVREGLVLTLPNIEVTYNKNGGFVAENDFYKLYTILHGVSISHFLIEKV